MRHHKQRLSIALIGIVLASAALFFWPSSTRIYALDMANGRIRWSQPLPGPVRPFSMKGALGNNLILLWGGSSEPSPGAAPTLTAFDLATGAPRWVWPGDQALPVFPAEQQPFAPLVLDDRAIVLLLPERGISEAPVLVAIDLTSGTTRWEQPLTGTSRAIENTGFLIASDTTVVLGYADPAPSNTGRLAAFDIANGSPRWQQTRSPASPDGDGIPFAATIVDKALFVRGIESLDRYELTSGTLISSEPIARRSLRPYTATLGAELVTEDPGGLVAFDLREGKRWRVDLPLAPEQQTSGLLAGDQTVLISLLESADSVADYTNSAIVLNLADGSERWRLTTPATNDEGFSGDTLIQRDYGDRPQILARSLGDGSIRWSFPLRESGAVVVPGEQLLFVTDTAPAWRDWLAVIHPALR